MFKNNKKFVKKTFFITKILKTFDFCSQKSKKNCHIFLGAFIWNHPLVTLKRIYKKKLKKNQKMSTKIPKNSDISKNTKKYKNSKKNSKQTIKNLKNLTKSKKSIKNIKNQKNVKYFQNFQKSKKKNTFFSKKNK